MSAFWLANADINLRIHSCSFSLERKTSVALWSGLDLWRGHASKLIKRVVYGVRDMVWYDLAYLILLNFGKSGIGRVFLYYAITSCQR